MSDDNLQKTSHLSSICDELRSTAQQRDLELQDISQLLEGIKQLQAAQLVEHDAAVEGTVHNLVWATGAATAAATAAEGQLQQAMLSQSLPVQRQETGPCQLTAVAAQAQEDQGSAHRRTAGTATPASPAHNQGQTWPQAELLQLLQEANSSDSTEGNALCRFSSRSSIPDSSPTSHRTSEARAGSTGQQQDPSAHALSRFSFPAGGTAGVHKYITPLKIPHPVRTRSTRCSNIDSNSGDSSSIDSGSSGHGSYVSQFFQGKAGQTGTAGDQGLPHASVGNQPAGAEHCSSQPSPIGSPVMDASPVAQQELLSAAEVQQRKKWQLSASPSPRLTPTSSMSSEAAALMLALRAAAQQREAAREVLQARSSMASTAMTRNTPTPREGSPVDWGYKSDDDDRHIAEEQLQSQHQPVAVAASSGVSKQRAAGAAAAKPTAAGAAARNARNDGNKHASLQDKAQQQKQQHRRARGSTHSSGTTQPSAVGPQAHYSSSNSSVHRSQRAAVDRLMQEAMESSSMSSLMGLLGSQGDSEEEQQDESAASLAAVAVAAPAPAAAAVARPRVVVPPTAEFSAAHTWGSSSGSTPVDCGAAGVSSQGGITRAPKGKLQDWGHVTASVAQAHQEHGAQQRQRQQSAKAQHLHAQAAQQEVGRTSSVLSGGASGLQFDALSAELELLTNQVEKERQQLEQLQQQRQHVEHQIAADQPTVDSPANRLHLEQQQCSTARVVELPLKQQQKALRCSRSCSDLQATARLHVMDVTAISPIQQHPSSPGQPLTAAAAVAAGKHHTLVGDSGKTVAAPAAAVPTSEVCIQADSGAAVYTGAPQGVDAACQALLLHVSGLPVVGPPAACRACPDAQLQLKELQNKLQKSQEQLKQAQLFAEQSRHQAMTAEAQLALSRQKLRAVLSANAKPLAMSGWEDLIEEAAADLERIEGHVATAAARLIELQASSTSAAETLIACNREADRQQAAAASAALRTEELQQQAEGLVAAISNNEHSRNTSDQQLQALQEQLEHHKSAAVAAKTQLTGLQEQLQQVQQQVAVADQQLAEKESGKQQLVAEMSDKQHQLQVMRGDCASAQDRLSQLQTSLVEARQQLEDLQQQHRQQQRLHEDTSKQLAALQAQRSAASAETAGAQQELSRVLRELEQCQQDVQAAELQHAELEEAAAERQQHHKEESKAAAAVAKQRQDLEADVAAAQEQLKQLQQQAQAAKYEADLCTRAAAAADRQLHQVQQTLSALQSGAVHTAGNRSTAADASNAAAAAAATATAHLAECAQLQVKLAAAESRRQLAEEKAEESDRRIQQLKLEVGTLKSQHDAADKQLRQVTSKCEKLKEKLRGKCESLTEVQGQLQQAQLQVQSITQAAAAAAAQGAHSQQQHGFVSKASAAAAAEHAEAQQLLQIHQKQLKILEADLSSAHSQVQQAEQQLEQQRQANSNLQQQLSTTQQQLVQAQQQLLEVSRQFGGGAVNQQQQADQMHMAVRSSIQGLHEALGMQSKLQHAQLQADTAKQQLQELQQDKKQLQKKLAAYKQQLGELKSIYDGQCLQLQQQASTNSQGAQAAAADASATARDFQQQKEQLELLKAELAAAKDQVTNSEQQLKWADREAEHLKQLLQQQQEISSQLRSEIQRLQQQEFSASQQAVAQLQVPDVAPVAAAHAQDEQGVAAAAAAAAQLQQTRAELSQVKQQLLQAHAEWSAAKQQLNTLQQQLNSSEQLQQQHMQQLSDTKQQLQQKEAELLQKAQQLVQQQQEHKWQEVQWEQKVQAVQQQTGQDLLECRAELASSQAALKQLQGAAIVVEQQLAAAVEAAQHRLVKQADTAKDSSVGISRVTHVVSPAGTPTAAKLTQAVQLVQHLSETCLAALDAKLQLQQQFQFEQTQWKQQLQQQTEQYSSQLQQLVKAIEVGESCRQEGELRQLHLQQECQLLRLQQQQHGAEQAQLPGHMQSMSSVINIMNQLHAATQQSVGSAAAWGTSSCGVLHESAAAGTAAPAPARGTAWTTPVSTPHMSMEVMAGLAPPASCLSPEVPGALVTAATGVADRKPHAAADANVKPIAARGLQYGGPSTCAGSQAGPGCSRPDNEMAQLRQRLMRLSQDMMLQLQNPGQVLLQQQRPPQSIQQVQQPTIQSAATHVAQQQHSGVASTSRGLPEVALADAELQKSWQWLQEQAAGHDRLLRHMDQMWTQAAMLAEQCMALQAAAAAAGSQHSPVQAAQQQRHEQQQQLSRSPSPASPAAAAGAVDQTAPLPAAMQAFLTAVQPLITLAQQLQCDITDLSHHNKRLLEAAKKLCSSFRSGGRAVRVRALALKLDLQQHGVSAPNSKDRTGSSAGEQQGQPGAQAAAIGAVGSVLPTEVAVAVVQHWNEVESLLAQLHQSCESLLQVPGIAKPVGLQQQQRQQDTMPSGCNSPRKHAARRCRKILEGLQRLTEICRQHQQARQLQHHERSERLGSTTASPVATATHKQPQQLRSNNSRDGSGEYKSSTPPNHQQEGQNSTHYSSSCSSCSSEGLGSLLAMLKSRVAGEGAGASLRAVAVADGAGQTGVIATKQHKQKQSARPDMEQQPTLEPQVAAASSKVAAIRPLVSVKKQHSSHKVLQIVPSQHLSSQEAGRDRLSGLLVAASAAELQLSGAGAHSWGSIDVASSASVRRAERAVLVERLKLLQQQ